MIVLNAADPPFEVMLRYYKLSVPTAEKKQKQAQL